MSRFRLDITDFIECLEVLPMKEEDGVYYILEVLKDGLKLQVTLWPYDN